MFFVNIRVDQAAWDALEREYQIRKNHTTLASAKSAAIVWFLQQMRRHVEDEVMRVAKKAQKRLDFENPSVPELRAIHESLTLKDEKGEKDEEGGNVGNGFHCSGNPAGENPPVSGREGQNPETT